MTTLLVTPRTPEELARLEEYLKQAHIESRILSEEDQEDLALLQLMSEVDTEDTVSAEEIKKILEWDLRVA